MIPVNSEKMVGKLEKGKNTRKTGGVTHKITVHEGKNHK